MSDNLLPRHFLATNQPRCSQIGENSTDCGQVTQPKKNLPRWSCVNGGLGSARWGVMTPYNYPSYQSNICILRRSHIDGNCRGNGGTEKAATFQIVTTITNIPIKLKTYFGNVGKKPTMIGRCRASLNSGQSS